MTGMGKAETALEVTSLAASLMAAFRGNPAHGSGMGGRIQSFLDAGGADVIKQQMPKMFGIGFGENSLTALLLGKLTTEEAAKLERLLKAMTDYERYFFWMTITSIQLVPKSTTKTVRQDGGKNPADKPTEDVVQQTLTVSEIDDRVKTLQMIVARIGDTPDGRMREVVNSLYNLRILEQSPIVKTWAMYSKGFKVTVLDPLEVNSLKELVDSPKVTAFIAERNAKRAKPVSMSLWGRFANTGLTGAKPVPEPLLQGDGAINTTLRMFGIRSRRK